MTHAANSGHFLCRVDQLEEPGSREFSIGEGEWPLQGFVVRFKGEVRAFVNRCPHMGVPLNYKPDLFFAPRVPMLMCFTHGALFLPLTGECVGGPCVGRKLEALDIEVMDGEVWLRALPAS
jgi:nitrite reductase/ring-hydroxylating ferredoxin subunit